MNKTFGVAILVILIIGGSLAAWAYITSEPDPISWFPRELGAFIIIYFTAILVAVLSFVGAIWEFVKRAKSGNRQSLLIPTLIILVILAAVIYYYFRSQISL